MSKNKSGLGCGGAFLVVLGIALLITYWYLFVAAAVLGGAIWYYYHRKHAAAAAAKAQAQAEQAKTERQRALAGTQVDQIRQFKQLLDEGAITQTEFDREKAKILHESPQEEPLKY